MSEQKDITVFGYHVLCMVDVLGQKQKLAQWADLPDDGQITPGFVEAIKQTVGTVLAFREQFIKFFDQVGRCTIPDKVASLSKEQQETYFRHKECKVDVERLADTLVFHSLIPNSYGDASISPLYRILGACAMAMVWSLAAKTPLRGAVTIGAGAKLEDGWFYGPALAEAHHLESEVAGQPRVVVSRSARAFLEEGHPYSEDVVASRVMAALAAQCRSLICQDVDGWWIVDFLGEGIRQTFPPATPMVIAVQSAYEFVRSEAERFRSVGDAKLAGR